MKEVLSLKQAITATLQYFDIVEFAPAREEAAEYLYGWSAPKEAVFEALNELDEISSAHGFYFLHGREELAEARLQQEKIEKQLWRIVRRFAWVFALCPFLRMAAVCNSLALGNVKETSDIDVFVVAAAGRLTTARFFLKLFTQILGIRAHHEKVKGRFCLSFFVTEKAMNLSPLAHEFDPHLAYFAATMKPFYGEKTYRAFLKENDEWSGRYFRRKLSSHGEHMGRHFGASFFRVFFEFILQFFGGAAERFCENFLAKREKEYRKKFNRAPGVVISKNVFKFHENDPREEIAEKFEALATLPPTPLPS